MANSRNEAVKPLPFPGESPTVALALAAGQKYGVRPDDEKPARTKPKRKAAAKRARARTAAGSRKAPKQAAGKARKAKRPARSLRRK